MNILFIVPYTPTPIRTRPYNLIRALGRRGHEITLATLWQSDDERETLRAWEEGGVRVVAARLTKVRSAANCLRALPTRTPLQAVWCWQPDLMQQIAADGWQASEGRLPFDVIHVEHLRGAHYALALKSRFIVHHSSFRIPILWDSVDCITYLFEQAARDSRSRLGRWMTRLELARTRRYEAWLLTQFDHILVTSQTDKQAFEHLVAQRSNIRTFERLNVLPNGVALDHFTPGDEPRDLATVVFSGKMSYHANITAALHLANDIMPRVWARRPDVSLYIVGKDPPAEICALADQHATRNTQHAIQNAANARRSTLDAPRIVVTGTIPDLRPYLRSATVAAAPILYGAGVQNKVLEAMACGTPVVASPVAVSALDVADGAHLLVAEGTDRFAEAILRLLDDTALRERLSVAGRRYVEQHHDWGVIASQLVSIYESVERET